MGEKVKFGFEQTGNLPKGKKKRNGQTTFDKQSLEPLVILKNNIEISKIQKTRFFAESCLLCINARYNICNYFIPWKIDFHGWRTLRFCLKTPSKLTTKIQTEFRKNVLQSHTVVTSLLEDIDRYQSRALAKGLFTVCSNSFHLLLGDSLTTH